jgi:hypothetical protein
MHRKKWFKRLFRSENKGEGIVLCRPCHNAVHRFISEKELAKFFHSADRIMGHPQIEKFVTWRKKTKQ